MPWERGARRCGRKRPARGAGGNSDSSERLGAASTAARRQARQPGDRDLRLAGGRERAGIDAEAGNEDRYAVAADDRPVAQRRRDAARLELQLQAARRSAGAGLEAIAGRARAQLRGASRSRSGCRLRRHVDAKRAAPSGDLVHARAAQVDRERFAGSIAAPLAVALRRRPR